MSIIITVANEASTAGFADVEALARQLFANDKNFQGRTMEVRRGAATRVTDDQDQLRQALLQLMVDGVLAAA